MAEAATPSGDLGVTEVVSIKVGNCFDSFDALQTKIKVY